MMNEVDDEFQKLRENYGSHLSDKINELELFFDQLLNQWCSANFTQFASSVHKLNGSAGIYGYTEIGKLAANIEAMISNLDHETLPQKLLTDPIQQMIFELKNKVQSITPDSPALSMKKIDTSTIFLLNAKDDFAFGKKWSDDLVKQLDVFSYKLSVFNDINLFFSALNTTFPLAIMVSLDFILNPFVLNATNNNIKEILLACFKNNYTLFFSKSGEIEKRLEAVKMNGKSFFLLPFEISELSSELNGLKRLWEEKYKVIIVDDDQETLNYQSNLLSNAGIENKTLLSYKEIEKTLHEFKPDLLLFDINMEGCNGVELATIIRQQKMYEYIPIIYLSTEENKNVQIQALNVGADDFITKGTDPNIIIKKIRIRANRYKKIQMLASKNSLTGAFNFEYMIKEIERFIRNPKNASLKLTIAVLKIDNLNMIIQTYGYYAADQLLTSLYVFLDNQLDFSRIVGHYSDNQCLIVFPDTTQEKAEEELKKLKEKFSAVLHYGEGKAYFSSFSMVVSTYEKQDSIKKFIDSTAAKLK